MMSYLWIDANASYHINGFLITTFYQPCLYYAYQKQP